MDVNANILNSSDKVLTRFVAMGEGDVSIYKNLREKALVGSTYLDTLNKTFYEKMSDTGVSSDDWVKIGGVSPTKPGVFPVKSEEVVLGVRVGNIQDNILIGSDDKVTGNLHYVSEWKEFSSIEKEQSGYYLSLLIPRPEGTTEVKVKKDSDDEKTIKSEDIVVRVEDSTSTLLITVTTKAGTVTRTLNLSQLKKL